MNFKLYRIVFCVALGLFLGSCKSKKAVADGEVNTSLSTKKIIQKHYENSLDFDTMSGKVKIDYVDGETEQGVTVSLRMKKDSAIWVSAPLGMFKAFISPERVSFYNRLENEYFEGDFTYLTELLGSEMDFEKVQNLLIGNTVLDLRKEKYVSYSEQDSYMIKPKVQQELYKILFALEPRYFKVKQQQLSQPELDRFLTMEYKYQTIGERIVPSEVAVEAINDKGLRKIALDFKNLEFGRDLNFPYKIPKGFKSIAAR